MTDVVHYDAVVVFIGDACYAIVMVDRRNEEKARGEILKGV